MKISVNKFRKLAIALVSAISAFYTLADSETVNGIEWNYYVEDGNAIIEYMDSEDVKSLTIPSTLGGCPVTSIGDFAFECYEFTSVFIPSTVTNVGDCAFWGCYNLKSVTGGENLKRVGLDAFAETIFLNGKTWNDDGYGLDLVYIGNFIVGKRGLLNEAWDEEYWDDENDDWIWEYDLKIPEGTTGMADGLFSELPITSVTIPGSVKRIPEYAFASCCNLKSLTINEGVKEIEASAFECAGCEWGLDTLVIPSSVTKIGEYAFAGFGYLKYVTGLDDTDEVHSDAFAWTLYDEGWDAPLLMIEDGVVYGLEWETRFDDGCITNGILNIPEGITNIAEYAFSGVYEFNKVIFPSSLRSIGDYAFECCEELREVEGGNNLERAGRDVFEETLFLYGADSWEEVYENEDYDNGYGLDLVYVGNFIVGKRGSLEEAWNDEYYGRNDNWLWEYDLVIPEGTTGMADELFAGLPITSVKIPGSVKRIPEYAFASCCYLKNLTINEGVEEIEASAFECAGCEWYEDGITTLTIPSSVTKIGEYAFADFGYLKYVIGLDDTDDVHVDAFESTLYRYGWESPMLVIEGATVTGIEWETRFDDGCVTNGVLCIPQSVTNIADWALSGAYGFHKVMLPNTLLALGEGAFCGCYELEEVEIPASIKRISEYAFASCCNLKSLVINEGVEEIGASAFECAGCEWGLDTLVIPSSVTKIGEYAFASFGYLKYVTGLDDTDDVHEDAFAGAPYVEGWDAPLLVIEDGVALGFNWETRFDDGCITNGVLIIPEGVTNIAENAFSGEYGFNKVILPSSLRSIGEEAFEGCEELREVEGGVNLERVGYGAFEETLFLYGADSWDEVGYKEEYYGLDLVYVGNFIVGKRGYLEEAFGSEYMDGEYWIWEYELEIPEGTIGMADSLFSELPITSVTIPGSVKRIPECAFAVCCYLKNLTINEGVEEIEASAFECAGCNWDEDGITTLTIPSSVTKIEECAFAGFGYLKYVTGLDDTDEVHSDAFAWTLYDEGWDAPLLMIEDGVVYGLEWETRFDDGCITNGILNIPEGITNIAEYAFSGVYEFNKVIFPSSLRSIGDYAFECCEELREVESGANLERVGYGVFEDTLFLYGADSWDEVWENEDYDNGYGLDLLYVGNFIVGKRGWLNEAWNDEYYDEEGNWIWEYDLVIPEGTTGMADSLFSELPVTSVTIPGSVKRIPECAFASCCYLKNLTINEGVEEIEASAFECAGCNWNWDEDGITTLTIPSSVTKIGEYAFAYFGYLKYVTGLGDTDEVHSDAFAGTPCYEGWEAPVLRIEDGVVRGLEWETRFDDGCIIDRVLTIPEGVTGIFVGAFQYENGFDKVILPSSLREIGNSAFYGCEELRKVEGGENLEYVAGEAFEETLFLYGADSWDEVYENEDYEYGYGLDLVYIGNFIVGKRGYLEEAWNYEYYDEDGNWIWEYDLVIPEGTTGIANWLFADMPITSVTIPGSIKTIPFWAFSGSYIKDLILDEGVEEIDSVAFYGCESLRSVILPSTVKNVRDDAFGDCENLKNVTFKSEDIVFDARAFRVCIPIGEPNEYGYYDKLDYSCSTNLNPLVFEKVGHSLVGWRTEAVNGADKALEALFGPDDLTPFASPEYCGEWAYDEQLEAEVGYNVIPVIEKNKYLIEFDSNGGLSVDNIEVAYDSAYGELPVPERTGYTFAGWYNGETLVTSETVAGVGNQSLVAKWTANTYTIKYDSNGGEGSMLNQVLTYDVASILNPCAFDRSGYEFIGWALSPTSDSVAYQDRASVKNLISENDGSLTLYALWDRTTLWMPPVSDDGTSGGETPEVGGDEFTGEYAEVYDGYICDDDIVIGTIQAKTAKAKKGVSKVTVTIQIKGEKKLTLKGDMAVEDAEFEAVAKDGRVLVLQFGLNGIFGDFDGYLIDGAKNFFSSKDKTEKAEAEDILESYLGAYTMVCDDGNLSITIAKKGKVTVKGVIDGNKVSAKAQALIGADVICIPVVYSKKSVNLAFTIYLPLDGGEAEVVGLDNAIIGKAGTLKDGAKFIIDGDIGAYIETEDSRTLELLPNNETITVSKSKWLVAGGIKAAKVAYKKGEFTITEGKKGAGIVNPSGLKLSYKSKDGSFTGSFTAYAIVKGKLKKHKATVEGVLVNGIGYGTITIKKIGTWDMAIE